jgi:hypothetical protein
MIDGLELERSQKISQVYPVLNLILSYLMMSNKVSQDAPNYCKVSHNMEVSGLVRLVDNIRKHPEIVGQVREFLNPGHAMRSFEYWTWINIGHSHH